MNAIKIGCQSYWRIPMWNYKSKTIYHLLRSESFPQRAKSAKEFVNQCSDPFMLEHVVCHWNNFLLLPPPQVSGCFSAQLLTVELEENLDYGTLIPHGCLSSMEGVRLGGWGDCSFSSMTYLDVENFWSCRFFGSIVGEKGEIEKNCAKEMYFTRYQLAITFILFATDSLTFSAYNILVENL